MVEVGMMAATILTNVIYLMFRSQLSQKQQIKIPGMLLNEDTDFLVSQQTLIGYQVSFNAVNYLTNFFITSGLVNESDPGYKVLAFQRPFNIF
jgi:uncharacterized membrane protein